MSKAEDKNKILDLVHQYARRYHTREPYQEGNRIPYGGRVFDEQEVANAVDAALDFWLTADRWTAQFEQQLCDFLSVKHAFFVNSGSSANLLALSALMSPFLGKKRLEKGDEVITAACGFPTTVAPIVQLGLVPVFVDMTPPTYNVLPQAIAKAISPKTKAVFLAHTLGNPFQLEEVKHICEQNGLWLIEDSCDALGAKVQLEDKEVFTGSVGHLGTFSFYPSHHITTGEGGAVVTNDPLLARIVQSLRGWGRDCICPPGTDNYCGARFTGTHGNLPSGYDHKYVYSHFGYNLKATDLQAAIGVAQMEKLPSFLACREANFHLLDELLRGTDFQDRWILPQATSNSTPAWFGYPITGKEGVDVLAVVRQLEADGVQTRKLFAGNILRQPCMEGLEEGRDYRVSGSLEGTDIILERTFWVGISPLSDENAIRALAKLLHKAGMETC